MQGFSGTVPKAKGCAVGLSLTNIAEGYLVGLSIEAAAMLSEVVAEVLVFSTVDPVMKVVVAAVLSKVVAEVLLSSTVDPLASVIVEDKTSV